MSILLDHYFYQQHNLYMCQSQYKWHIYDDSRDIHKYDRFCHIDLLGMDILLGK